MVTKDNLMRFRLSFDPLPSSNDALRWFEILEAGWFYSGDPQKPHAKLRSGKCSDGFFLCKKVLKYGNLREIMAAVLIKALRESGLKDGLVDGVFGSPNSSITLAAEVGRLLGVPNYIPEKDVTGKGGMVFNADDPIPKDSVLLQVEELVTTFHSGTATCRAIIDGNPYPVRFVPFVGVLVYRPPVLQQKVPDGRKIVPFVERVIKAWDPAECPLCSKGSKPISPKTNWAELNAK